MTVASTYSTPEQKNIQASVSCFLESLLQKQASTQAITWLLEQGEKISSSKKPESFFISFSAASRFFESRKILLSEQEKVAAKEIRPGFMPEYWNQLQAARTLLLLKLPHQDREHFEQTLTRLAETADVGEQTALYAALPLLPHPESLQKRAADGIRTNITVVFDAIALNNPYPADYLTEAAWNQMVLKAVFMSRPLYQIWGAEDRANPELAQMLLDFAHERWAAHRNVTPELWRFVGPYLQPASFTDIEKVSQEGTPVEREAVLLACSSSTLPQAQQLLNRYSEQAQQIKARKISWVSIGQRYNP